MREALFTEQLHLFAPSGMLDAVKAAAKEEGQTARVHPPGDSRPAPARRPGGGGRPAMTTIAAIAPLISAHAGVADVELDAVVGGHGGADPGQGAGRGADAIAKKDGF